MAEKQMVTLEDVAKRIKKDFKKVSLIYAFNATGKTRLSLEFKKLITPETDDEASPMHVLYFNAFTEDLFYWNNDLENDSTRRMNININSKFVKIIKEQGKETDISRKFQQLTRSKIDPEFDFENGEISFHLRTGDDVAEHSANIKISRGEERIFIWSVFYVLLETVMAELEEDQPLVEFRNINYVFIDDPISSLDDSYTIDVAIDLANLIMKAEYDEDKGGMRFILTTHHPLFYNILNNEFGRKKNIVKQLLRKTDEGFTLASQDDSPFGYHLVLIDEINRAIKEENIKQYHFNLMRNLLEKTATFMGYTNWSDCIFAEEKEGYVRRLNFYSHSSHAEFTWKEPEPEEKNLLTKIFNEFISDFKFNLEKN